MRRGFAVLQRKAKRLTCPERRGGYPDGLGTLVGWWSVYRGLYEGIVGFFSPVRVV